MIYLLVAPFAPYLLAVAVLVAAAVLVRRISLTAVGAGVPGSVVAPA